MPKEKKNGDPPYGALLMVARKLEFPCSGTPASPHARSLLVFSSNPTGHQPFLPPLSILLSFSQLNSMAAGAAPTKSECP